MVDVKKLITGFLILAAATTASAIGLSTLGGTVSTSPSAPSRVADTNTAAPLAQNAFADNSQLAGFTGVQLSASATDPNNLTATLSSAFMNGILAANPNGPTTDASGTPSFDSPDTATIAAAIAENPTFANLQIPNWDISAADQKLNITDSAASSDIAMYNSSLGSIINKYFVNTDLQSKLSTANADPSQIPYVDQQLAGALQEISAVKTPAPLAAFQKSLVTMLVYEKNAVELAANAGDDPVKISLVLHAEDLKFQTAQADFTQQLQKAQSAKLVSLDAPAKEDHGVLATLRNLLGIQTAHAQWIVFDPTIFMQMIWQWVQEIVLQILKNTLINLIQNNVLKWVQGAGVPRFIQVWGRTLVNSFNNAALAAISQSTQGLYPGFAPSVRSTLSQFYNQLSSPGATPLQIAIGNNPQPFYNNFSNGGWPAYGATLLSSGDFYGSTYFTAQAVRQSANTQQAAIQAQHIAAQGTTGDMVCSDGSNPQTGTHMMCIDQIGGELYPNSNGQCDPGDTQTQVPNAGLCANGSEPIKTTPGIVTAQGIDSAIGSPVHLIVNADNIIDLVISLANSLLNTLINKAITAGTSAINGGLAGSGSAPPPPSVPPAQPVMCTTPLSSLTLPASGTVMGYFNASGGPTQNGVPPSYSWSVTGGVPSSPTGVSITVNYAIRGTFTATVTASTGGSSTCTVTVQ